MGRKRKGKAVRKNKNLDTSEEPEELTRAPHSFVLHRWNYFWEIVKIICVCVRGKTGKFVQELTSDFRQVMEPFTASNIKVRPKNVIKDFVHVAGVMKVSWILVCL